MGLEPNPQPAHNQEQAGRHMVRGKENVLAAPPAVYPPSPQYGDHVMLTTFLGKECTVPHLARVCTVCQTWPWDGNP